MSWQRSTLHISVGLKDEPKEQYKKTEFLQMGLMLHQAHFLSDKRGMRQCYSLTFDLFDVIINYV